MKIMKNTRKKIYLVITLIILSIIIFFLASRKNDNVNSLDKPKVSASKTVGMSGNTDISTIDQQNLPSNAPPEWAKKLMEINANTAFSREEKIQQLVNLLKQNNDDSQAISGILISLTTLNPIEVVDDIIPYLKNKNAIVQSAALGALNNASLLTPKEHELKQPLSENNDKRERIAKAVNELKADTNIDEDVKQALISSYSGTNPSLEDSRTMTKEILSQNIVTPNEASYIASSVLNGKDIIETLKVLSNKDSNMKDTIISSMGASIAENPKVTSTLSTQQKMVLESFIKSNPPQSSGDNFGYQNDQWKNTINVLNGNI